MKTYRYAGLLIAALALSTPALAEPGGGNHGGTSGDAGGQGVHAGGPPNGHAVISSAIANAAAAWRAAHPQVPSCGAACGGAGIH